MGVAKNWDERSIALRYEKRGQGIGRDYVPWLRTSDFPSEAPQTQVPSAIVGRPIHCFSYLERDMYQYLEWQGGVSDYREQFPMDRRITAAAALRLGIRHSIYRSSGALVVMTTDALIVRSHGGLEGWDAKPSHMLKIKRVTDKLRLHKAWCEEVGATHHIFTQHSVNKHCLANIDRTRAARLKPGESQRCVHLFATHQEIIAATIIGNSRGTIESFCRAYDKTEHLPVGFAIRLVFDLIWSKKLIVDLDLPDLHLTRLRSIRSEAPQQGLLRA